MWESHTGHVKPVCQPVNQSASQSVNQPVSQQASQEVSQSVSKPSSQPGTDCTLNNRRRSTQLQMVIILRGSYANTFQSPFIARRRIC